MKVTWSASELFSQPAYFDCASSLYWILLLIKRRIWYTFRENKANQSIWRDEDLTCKLPFEQYSDTIKTYGPSTEAPIKEFTFGWRNSRICNKNFKVLKITKNDSENLFQIKNLWIKFKKKKKSRIHRLHLCRGISPPPSKRVSWIWHKTIWLWVSSNIWALGNLEYLFIAPRSSLPQSGSTW